MRDVWVIDDSIISPLGKTSAENFHSLKNGVSGVKPVTDSALSPSKFPVAKIKELTSTAGASRFENLCLDSLLPFVKKHNLPRERTLFILSSTKGNIEFLENNNAEHPRIGLSPTASFLADKIGLQNYLVVSNACISGVMAITVAKRFLSQGIYDHAVILGADVLSAFVLSGFQSLQALSDDVCKPFDAARKGINLGEAAAALILSTRPEHFKSDKQIKILGSGLSNDANHISGPSRTGEELAKAIHQSLKESNLGAKEIELVSAHGTATIYNDDMESKAFQLCALANTPVNSLKSYYGHTLGAAGILETIIGIHSMKESVLIPTLGFETPGTSQSINVIKEIKHQSINRFLKTASGFGGCNAALILEKLN